MNSILLEIDVPQYRLIKKGKVRSLFDIGENHILIVSSDRISAFDVVLPTGIPQKGIILTQISNFWFQFFSKTISHHLVSTDISSFIDVTSNTAEKLKNRSIIAKKTKVLPFECIVRGYISGSLWRLYKKDPHQYFNLLPKNLKESDKLSEPIFTPTNKASSGHDTPVTENEMIKEIGKDLTEFLKETSLYIYKTAHDYLQSKGLILADTKMEFGLLHDKPVLIDELLTPDSSRFWEKNHMFLDNLKLVLINNLLETSWMN